MDTNTLVVEQPEGWTLAVLCGNRRRSVTDHRTGKPRLFATMTALQAYLDRFQLRLNADQAARISAEATAFDQWFLEQVDLGLDDSGEGVPDEEVKAIFAARKAAKRTR